MNKRGISALVATVLLVLITVAAVGIIWGAIMPMITRTMQLGQACIDAMVLIKEDRTCIDTNNNEVHVMVQRGTKDFNLSAIALFLEGEAGSKGRDIKDNKKTDGVRMFDKTYDNATILPGTGEFVVYVINSTAVGISNPTGVSVAPVVKSGDIEKMCDTISVSLKSCA